MGTPEYEVQRDVNNESSREKSTGFIRFSRVCEQIGAERGKLEKIRITAEYLRELTVEELVLAATWFTGQAFPSSQNRPMRLGGAVLRDTLSGVAQVPPAAFHEAYLRYSDVGETAAELLRNQRVEPSLSLLDVNRLFQKLHAARGPLAKTPLLISALKLCTANEAKYLVKILTGDLRIGLKEGLLEEGVATAFGQQPEGVRQANLLLGDIGEAARLAAENRLADAVLAPFRPVKFMLASPEPTAAAVWERRPVGDEALWVEDKYDGIRCQLHKAGERVELYSRELKPITVSFLELADAARKLGQSVVVDGEIVAMRGEQVLPFAELQKRLGRRGDDLFLRHEVPVQFVIFDLLWREGESLLESPLKARRQLLDAMTPLPTSLRLARITRADSVSDLEAAFAAARTRGNEGLMIKDPGSVYAPGRRGLAWLKLKQPLATLDCVVVGVEYGHGKRNKVLSDYTFAVRDEPTGELKTIGKAYTGLTDAEIAERTEHFLKVALGRHGRYFEVLPDTVIEVAFDRIAPSARHSSGLALRFPRIVRLRMDKPVSEIDTVQAARRMADGIAREASADKGTGV
jgi:DNA ligase-1